MQGIRIDTGSMVQERMASAVRMCGAFNIEVQWSGLEMRRGVPTSECGVCSQFKFAMGAALRGRWATGARATRGTCRGFKSAMGAALGMRQGMGAGIACGSRGHAERAGDSIESHRATSKCCETRHERCEEEDAEVTADALQCRRGAMSLEAANHQTKRDGRWHRTSPSAWKGA
jgi:hypothetical protein